MSKIVFEPSTGGILMNDIFRVSTIKQERGLDYPFARSFEFSISAAF